MVNGIHENRIGLKAAIGMLKRCKDEHCDVIHQLEEYQRLVDGLIESVDEETGYSNGYAAELRYLHLRRSALDALIASVERYSRISDFRAFIPAAAA